MPKIRMYSVKDKRYREFSITCTPASEICDQCFFNKQCDKGRKSMTEKEIMLSAVMAFGFKSQKEMAKEECAELIDALCKEVRGRASEEEVVTEIADVMIMMEQLALIYGPERVAIEKARKLDRLEHRLREFIESL